MNTPMQITGSDPAESKALQMSETAQTMVNALGVILNGWQDRDTSEGLPPEREFPGVIRLGDLRAARLAMSRVVAMLTEMAESIDKLNYQVQYYVDGYVYYRNLAVTRGAKPEQMLSEYDRSIHDNILSTVEHHKEIISSIEELWDKADQYDQVKNQLVDAVLAERSLGDAYQDKNVNSVEDRERLVAEWRKALATKNELIRQLLERNSNED